MAEKTVSVAKIYRLFLVRGTGDVLLQIRQDSIPQALVGNERRKEAHLVSSETLTSVQGGTYITVMKSWLNSLGR